MTDADDVGLVKAFQIAVEAAASGGRRNWVMDDPKAALLGRLSAQAKEIEELREYKKSFIEANQENLRDINEHHENELAELRRERDEARRSAQDAWDQAHNAEVAVAEAMEVLAPFAAESERFQDWPDDEQVVSVMHILTKHLHAAHDFLAKHGERSDG